MSIIIKSHTLQAYGFRFSITRNGAVAGHAYLYIIFNDLHDRPVGLLEDICVRVEHRGRRIASRLAKKVVQKAKDEKCYKLIATSRNDGTRDAVHTWYQRLGFVDYGREFRMDF